MQKTKYIYVDSCVFLAYLQNETDRAETIQQLFNEITRPNSARRLVTSVLSIAEVTHGAREKESRRLDSGFEKKIDTLWDNRALIDLIEIHEQVAREARALMREAIPREFSLKPADALHLASAKILDVDEFFTYDTKLPKFSEWANFSIREPYVDQPLLPL